MEKWGTTSAKGNLGKVAVIEPWSWGAYEHGHMASAHGHGRHVDIGMGCMGVWGWIGPRYEFIYMGNAVGRDGILIHMHGPS